MPIIKNKRKKLYVGIGNPSKILYKTRHNLGYMVIDEIINNCTVDKCELGINQMYKITGEDIYLLKPFIAINDSVEEVKKAITVLGGNVEVIVFYDEMNVDEGKVDIKHINYTGGHNPLRNICSEVGVVKALALGIGYTTEDVHIYDFVLGVPDFIETGLIDSIEFCAKYVEMV